MTAAARRARALSVVAAMFVLALPAAAAATCAAGPVVAKSEPSRFEWTARFKARANWRSKVRAYPNLGPAFANWAKAQDSEERCFSGPAGSVCQLTGTPCSD